MESGVCTILKSHAGESRRAITVRIRKSNCRIRGVCKDRVRSRGGPLGLHPSKCPGRVGYIILSCGLLGSWIGRTQRLNSFNPAKDRINRALGIALPGILRGHPEIIECSHSITGDQQNRFRIFMASSRRFQHE